MLSKARTLTNLVLAAACALCASAASAQTSSIRPVTLLVPYAAGGPSDLVARALAPRVAEALGQPVNVENRPGASGNLATEAVARAAPDGHTLVLAATALTTNPVMMKAPSVDPLRQLAPVSQLVTFNFVLVTNPATGPRTLAELDAFARRADATCASPGGLPALGCEWLREVTQSAMTHVPYKGNAPALQDLIGGHVQFLFDNPNTALPHVRSGTVRALAMTGPRRAAPLPELPAVNERFPGFVLQSWLGVLAPAGTPAPVVDRLSAAFARALADPDIRRRFEDQGMTITATTPADFGRLIDHDLRKYARLVQQSGLSPE